MFELDRLAALADFHQLDMFTITELAQADADELYLRLQVITDKKHDLCVWDVFAAAIHKAKTGEKLNGGNGTRINNRDKIGFF